MNGPTKLTILRILLVPLIILFNYMDEPWSNWVSLAVFLMASLTDWLDGYLARKHDMVTMFGKLLDPLADKLLTLTAFLVILERHMLDAWVVIFMIGREMAITGLRAFLSAEHIVLAAGKLGKWKMTFQIICLSCLFLGGTYEILKISGQFFAYVALAFSLLSAYFYVANFWSLLGEKIMAEQYEKR